MSHIDEGLLHAHLDGALGPDERSRWAAAEAHLEVCPDCWRRLEEGRQMRDAAHALLSGAAVPPAAGRPAFAELVAQAEARAADARRGAGSATGAPGPGPAGRVGRTAPWWKTPAKLAWAASLLLAVGAGWIGRQLVVEEGGEVALLTTERPADAEPAAGALMLDRAEAPEPVPAKPEADAEARTATPPATRADPPLESDRIAEARAREPVPGEDADGRGDADEAQARDDAATDLDGGVRLQALTVKAAGGRCYVAADGPDRADPAAEEDVTAEAIPDAEADGRPAGDARVRELRLATDGTARLQLDTGPLVGFWEPAADSLHARVTDGRRWFDLRLADTESGLRGTAAPATGMDEPGRAAAANLLAGVVELVERDCPGD